MRAGVPRALTGAAEPMALDVLDSAADTDGGPDRRGAGPAVLRQASDAATAGEPFPLSAGQLRLWLLGQLFPKQSRQLRAVAVRLTGVLSEEALGRALDATVARHAALRMRVVPDGEEPTGTVLPPAPVPLPSARVRKSRTGESDADWEAAVGILAEREATRQLDLTAEAPLRASLVKRTPRDHVLLLLVHPLAVDAVGTEILLADIAAFYRAETTGVPPDLPPTIGLDAWNRVESARLEGGRLADDLAWWQAALADAGTPEVMPDREAAVPSRRAGRVRFDVPAATRAGIEAVATERGATAFAAVLAVWAALLARHGAGEDFVVGTSLDLRDDPAARAMVGTAANRLAVRVDLTDRPSLRQAAERLQRVIGLSVAHGRAPIERVATAVKAERNLARTPLVPVTLDATPTTAAPDFGSRLAATAIDLSHGDGAEDLALALGEGEEGGWLGWLDFSLDRYAEANARRIVGQFARLLGRAAAEPDRPLADLPLLDLAERAALLALNPPDAPVAEPATIHGAFLARAAAAPDETALVFGAERVRYGALADQSGALAARLAAEGVRPGARVGLCLDRTPRTIVALLATLRAGGVAVPLDPAYPAARLAFMAEDAGLSLVLTDAASEATAAATGARLLRVDDLDLEPDDRAAAASVDAGVGPDDPAYVVYTSGSTGTPKGVVGTHRGAVALARWIGAAHPFAPGETSAFTVSLSFVDAVWDLWGSLLNGAPVVVVPERDRREADRLIDALAEHGTGRIIAAASLLRAMLDTQADLASRLPRLRLLFSSAETLPVDLAERLRERVPQATLVNTYGSSEVTAVVTVAEVGPAAADLPRVPIGRPLTGSRVYVREPNGDLAPIGMPGELVVGGQQVALGYLGRPEVTAERFVDDPFAPCPGARLYRTGDRGRLLADGTLELLGRMDRLVKVRGFRVEPGEVEAVLGTHPAVREAVVVARDDGASGARLVAYVVPHDLGLTADEVRGWLRERLPDHLVPSLIATLPELPRTPTGKIDRRSLPEATGQSAAAYAPPRTPTEAALAGVWERVLGVERVGIHDNFFDVGGHSLLVARAMAALPEALGVELPLRALFLAPTVARLAESVDAMLDGSPVDRLPEDRATLVPLQETGSKAPVFLVPGGGGDAFNLFRFAKLFREIDGDRPAWGFLERGENLGQEADGDWVAAKARAYAEEIRTRWPTGACVLAGACAGGLLAFEVAQRLLAEGRDVAAVVLLDTWHPSARRTGKGERHTWRVDKGERKADRRRAREEHAFRQGHASVKGRRQMLHAYEPAHLPRSLVLLVNETWGEEDAALGWTADDARDLAVIPLPGAHGNYLADHLETVAGQMREVLERVSPTGEEV